MSIHHLTFEFEEGKYRLEICRSGLRRAVLLLFLLLEPIKKNLLNVFAD